MNQNRPVPDFLCIGAQKAGTSWLHWNLLFHPETSLPPIKEMHYFLYLAHPLRERIINFLWQGESYIRDDSWRVALRKYLYESTRTDQFYNPRWYRFFLYRRRSPENFRRLFTMTSQRLTGSFCPALGAAPEPVIRAYAEAAPDMKILYILRDPLERAWSQLRMIHGEALLEMSPSQIKKDVDLAVEYSRYARNISRWKQFFPDRLRILFHEDLARDPISFYISICAELGIAPLTDFKRHKLRERIHVSPEVEISPAFVDVLRERLLPDTQALHDSIGNAYTAKWLASLKAEAQTEKKKLAGNL